MHSLTGRAGSLLSITRIKVRSSFGDCSSVRSSVRSFVPVLVNEKELLSARPPACMCARVCLLFFLPWHLAVWSVVGGMDKAGKCKSLLRVGGARRTSAGCSTRAGRVCMYVLVKCRRLLLVGRTSVHFVVDIRRLCLLSAARTLPAVVSLNQCLLC